MSNSSEKKVLTINPELFKISKNNNNTTRKTRGSSEGGQPRIKVRDSSKVNSTSSKTLKRNLLNYIRKQQDMRSKQMFEKKETNRTSSIYKNDILDNDAEEGEFKESMDFLINLAKQKEQREHAQRLHNQTLRQHEPLKHFESRLENLDNYHGHKTDEDVHLTFPLDISQEIGQDVHSSTTQPMMVNYKTQPNPMHGCLKNGNLPTYRNWKNQTQKNYSPVTNIVGGNTQGASTAYQKSTEDIKNDRLQQRLHEIQQRVSDMKNRVLVEPTAANHEFQREKQQREEMHMEQAKQMPNIMRKPWTKMANKRRKTIRRTFQIGKSQKMPKVSVLISNKTIRKNVLNKKHMLHQVPINDVKKYLIKKGFIRVGSSAPSDVLRKMYESSLLMCGEIQNHNPDNLLYNFLNSKES